MRIIDGLKDARPNGYLESIRKGSAGVSRFRGGVYYGSGDRAADIADYIVVMTKERKTAAAGDAAAVLKSGAIESAFDVQRAEVNAGGRLRQIFY